MYSHPKDYLLLETQPGVKRMNRKIDFLKKSVHDLKRDNKNLKQQNQIIMSEISGMKT